MNTGPPVVVAAAVLAGGRVLAARRAAGPLAGRWEFPGGKVEDGESEPQALVRELAEELAITVRVGPELARVPLPGGRRLALYACAPVGGTLRLGADHDAARWVEIGDLDAIAWLDADRDVLPAIRAALAGRSTPTSV